MTRSTLIALIVGVGAIAVAFVVVLLASGSSTPAADTAAVSAPSQQPSTTLSAGEPSEGADTVSDGSPSSSPDRVVDRVPTQLPPTIAPAVAVWSTDWELRTIDLEELLLGIPVSDPRDRIRPIDSPVFEDAVSASEWLSPNEPGVLVDLDGDARFYPLRIMTAHEVVNDEIGGVPVAVTYCPLCNTAAVFSREVDGVVLRFGVSGLLRNSDLVMWDDSTDSLWQQITGEGIVGTYAGRQLRFIGSGLVRWSDFLAAHPDGVALSEDQGFGILYGRNPYVGYSSRPTPYGFFQEEPDPRFPALERVVGIRVDEATKAYPFSVIAVERAVNDTVAGIPVVVFWGAAATADALDARSVAEGKAIGTGVAYDRRVGDRVLTFEGIDDLTFRDIETGSTWTLLGLAVDGPLAGEQLEMVIHQNEFWFAWAAFNEGAPVHRDPASG